MESHISMRSDQVTPEHLTAILLFSCPDRKGLVSRISNFIFERGGNIIDLDEHVNAHEQRFFLRVAWDMKEFSVKPEQVEAAFLPMAKEFEAEWTIRLNRVRRRLAIFVSKYDHCLQEILWRHGMGEFDAEIAMIVSNHPDLGYLAERYHLPFHVFPISSENKSAQEAKELSLLEKERVDTVILARYMQVVSPTFVHKFPNRIINIHHSFLPAFAGSNPYKQAYERGVKIVGATSHYVTDILDEGPIIEQEIVHITHKDSLDDLIRKGRDLERLVLARALRLHFQDRILVHGRKTIVFE
ncbi:MAG TPA: formyltetrahydrofolate deformylase [Bacteroidota bacterium]|nr:formyltetrahydrofolate deformylase [Bacteroidota bacterium]